MNGAAPRAEKKSNFFLAFLMLSRPKREALSAIYAYCRLIDDIVDSGDLTKEDAGRQLDFWRAEIDRLFSGAPTHKVAQALLKPIADYAIPKDAFLEMIRGCAMDLNGTRYETIADLESYMRGVASSVGIMCIHIFGWAHTPKERVYDFAIRFGYAFQLTNIIRDVGVDLELGRVYVPLSDIRQASYSLENLMSRDHTPSFDVLMETQYRRAKDYYASARKLIDPRDRASLAPAEVMAHVYEGLLDDIRCGHFRVLHQKIRLPAHRKLTLALRGWLSSHGFGR